MAIYGVNQNRQFYVVKTTDDIKVVKGTDGTAFFQVKNVNGDTIATDKFEVSKVTRVFKTLAADMARQQKKITVTLDSNVSATPIAGQDYILRIQIDNYVAPGDANILIKVGAVRATKDMTAETFYKAMATSLTKSFARETVPTLTFEGTVAGLVITENLDQPWRRGVLSQTPVNFSATPTTITVDGDEVVWGVATKGVTGTTAPNSKEVADMEYFCMGERGDIFRNMGWPNNIDVQYMVDPANTAGYDLYDMHYYYSGDGVQVHKSEKDMTFAVPGGTDISTVFTALYLTVESKTT